MKSATDLLKQKIEQIKLGEKPGENKNYISQEFQDYGYRLAFRLDDLRHKSLYIRLAKSVPRAILEDAAAFVSDYPKAANKAKIFMWKYSELMRDYREKHPEFKIKSGKTGGKKKAKQEPEQKANRTPGQKPKQKPRLYNNDLFAKISK